MKQLLDISVNEFVLLFVLFASNVYANTEFFKNYQ